MEKEGRDCSSSFVSLCGARESTGTAPSAGFLRLSLCPARLSPPGVTKGAVTVSCLGCEREICSFMAGWLSPHPWGDGSKGGSSKGHSQIGGFGVEVVQTKQMVLNCHCSLWEMRVKESENWHLSISGHVQMMAVCKWRDQSLMYKELP